MAVSPRRTVITGVGVLSAIGLNRDDYWQALLSGRCGIRKIASFDASGLPVQIAGEIPNFDAKSYLDKSQRRNLKMMARTIQLAVAAAQLALDDGAVDKARLDKTRFGVEFGAGLIATELPELVDASHLSTNGQVGQVDLKKWGSEALPSIQPLWMLKYLPNMLACQVSILHDAQGPNNSITESDVASLLALGEAHRILSRDAADFFLVGGAESKLNPLSMVRQCLFEPLSKRNDQPEKACRPFDLRRDGMVLGEGGAVLAVEDLAHARQRGARIYAEVAGFGAAFDARRDGSGIARAVRAALREAGITPEQVDHINAHGLGSTDSDIWEARGLQQAFGSLRLPVIAPKAFFGNLGAGGGLTELVASILALHTDVLPGTINHDETDPACPVAVHTGAPREVEKPYAVKVGFTQMGQCAAIVLRKFSD